MKKIITLLLFTITFIEFSYSQGIGEWYIVKRNGVIELIVREDSICSRDLTFNFEPKRTGNFKCIKNETSKSDTIKLGYELLAISKSKKDTNMWEGTRIIENKKNLYQLVSWNSIDTITNNTSELIQLHKKDTAQHFGVYYFNKSSIDSLRRLKDMSSMDKKEFVNFFTEYTRYYSQFEKVATEKQIGIAVHFYNSQLITGILLRKGYNPFFKYETLDNFLMKYEDDKEIKKMVDSMTQ
jgi:hypothetical protein